MSKSVSVVIASLDGYREGNLPKLIEDLKKQSLTKFELIIVKGVAPCSRAHNIGVSNASGENIIFLDDDVTLGNEKVLENIIKKLKNRRIMGASQIIPPESNFFQKLCAKELHRTEFSVVDENTETDMVTHACMALRKEDYQRVGGENENLLRNDDLLLRYNAYNLGYKLIIVPRTWVYHPLPRNILTLLKSSIIYGVCQAHDYRFFPEYIYSSPINSKKRPQRSNLLKQIGRNIKIIILSLISIKPILVLSRVSQGLGFLYGYLHPKEWFNKFKKGFESQAIEKYIKKQNELIYIERIKLHKK